MIKTAQIVEDEASSEEVGLNDRVRVYMEDEDCEEEYKIVTTIRSNALKNMISIESPLGKALLGHKKDDRVFVQVKEKVGYYVKILEIMKSDDESEAINKMVVNLLLDERNQWKRKMMKLFAERT